MDIEPENSESEPQFREEKIGNITVRLGPVSESLFLSIDLRARLIGNERNSPKVLDSVMGTLVDVLVNTVVNPEDIGRIISEYAAKRVSLTDLLGTLAGVREEPDGNREDRRRNARSGRGSGRRPGRGKPSGGK
jgi:hypothetical protein